MQKWATLLLLALCLATTHGFVSEDEIEDNLQLLFGGEDAQDDGPTQPGLLSAVQEFELALNGLADSPQSYGTSVNKVGCDECLLGGIRNVMQTVGKKIREVCEKTQCPKVKEMCIRAAAHKELTLGYLIYKVRPVSHGFAYCFGSTSCDEKSAKDTSTNAASILVRALNLTKYESGGLYDFVSGTQDFLSHVDLSQVHHDLETQGADWIPISNRRELRGDTGEETECEGGEGGLGCHRGGHKHGGHHGGGRRNCGKCVRSTIGAVMQHVSKSVISYCTKYSSKNAKIKSWCRAGENNPKHAFGALLGAVAPWKFSAGYCFGHGDCQAHRGGHRGGSSSYQDTDTTLFS